MNVLAPVLRRFSPGGSGARLTILIFHRVYAAPDAIFTGEPDADMVLLRDRKKSGEADPPLPELDKWSRCTRE